MNLKLQTKKNEEGFAIFAVIAILLIALIIGMTVLTGATGGISDMGSNPDANSEMPPAGDENSVIPSNLPAPGNCLIWSWKVESSFISSLHAGSARLGLDPNWIMAIMAVETVSTFKPCIRNPYSQATGLIQFMPNTARDLGTSIDSLCGMSQTGQWRYVEEYLRRQIRANGRARDLGSAYMLVFTPIYTQSPDSKVMYRHDGKPCRVDGKMRKTAYCQNQVYDYAPKDGLITKFEAAEAARRKFREGYAGCTRKRN